MGESVHRSLPTLRVFFVANFLQHGQRSYQIKGALPFNFNLVHSNVHNTLLFLFSHSCGFFFGFLLVFLFYDIAEYWRLGLARFLPLRRAFPKQIIKCSGDLFKFQFYVTCFSKEVGWSEWRDKLHFNRNKNKTESCACWCFNLNKSWSLENTSVTLLYVLY